MEVIYDPTKDWELEIECSCTAKLRINSSDLRYNTDTERYLIDCVVCNDINHVDEDDIPYFVKKIVRQKAEAEDVW
jgi:hypothetical protein